MQLHTSSWAVFGVWSARRLYCSAVKGPDAGFWTLLVVIDLDIWPGIRWLQAVLRRAGRIKRELYTSMVNTLYTPGPQDH